MEKILRIQFARHKQIMKFVVSGGIAAAVNFFLLYLCTDFFQIWYMESLWIAYVVTFFVSFSLQRLWTFKDTSGNKVHKQLGIYFAVAVVGIIANSALMYYFVDGLRMHYLGAQFISLGLISTVNYFVYRKFIFVK